MKNYGTPKLMRYMCVLVKTFIFVQAWAGSYLEVALYKFYR